MKDGAENLFDGLTRLFGYLAVQTTALHLVQLTEDNTSIIIVMVICFKPINI